MGVPGVPTPPAEAACHPSAGVPGRRCPTPPKRRPLRLLRRPHPVPGAYPPATRALPTPALCPAYPVPPVPTPHCAAPCALCPTHLAANTLLCAKPEGIPMHAPRQSERAILGYRRAVSKGFPV